jgi:6-phosphogluconolactonase (cycloisomerase 2 family)
MADSYHNVLSVLAVDPASGNLGSVVATAETQTYPEAMAVDPSERFVYVANRRGNSISAFSIVVDNSAAPATMALHLLPGSPYAGGSTPTALAVDPTGHFLFAAYYDFDNAISVLASFAIDQQSGQLNQVGTFSAAGDYPSKIGIDPTGSFLYTLNQNSNDVSAYTIDRGGILHAIAGSPFAAVYSPSSLSIEPSGRFLYVANFDQGDAGSQKQGSISAYNIDPRSGALSSIGTFQSGDYTALILVDASGRYLYAMNNGSGAENNVMQYAIDPATGVLTMLKKTTVDGHASSGVMTSR